MGDWRAIVGASLGRWEKLVALSVASRADAVGEADLPIPAVAAEWGVSRRWVQQGLAHLRARGVLEVVARRPRGVRVRLVWDRVPQDGSAVNSSSHHAASDVKPTSHQDRSAVNSTSHHSASDVNSTSHHSGIFASTRTVRTVPTEGVCTPVDPSDVVSTVDPRVVPEYGAERLDADTEVTLSAHTGDDTAPARAADAPPAAVIELPLNDGTLYAVQPDDLAEWTALYPAVDVPHELRKMRGWLLANRANRKTRRGIMRFINGWLAKEHDRARRHERHGGPHHARRPPGGAYHSGDPTRTYDREPDILLEVP